ncbi:MAG: patatin-like phospholipase family protein [Alphaproteobacteria bacterium]|nr:patatin-like phospholipase family protein [Alphaproteobacteria bacterium]
MSKVIGKIMILTSLVCYSNLQAIEYHQQINNTEDIIRSESICDNTGYSINKNTSIEYNKKIKPNKKDYNKEELIDTGLKSDDDDKKDIIPQLKNKTNEDIKQSFNPELITINNNKPKYNRPIRILSLEGGGTRGYIQSAFLKMFCKEAEITNIGEYFDLIAGTSIGGLNAVAFASGYTTDYCCNFFREEAPWIFTVRTVKDVLTFSNNASIPSHKPNKLQMFGMGLFSNPFYKATSHTSNYGQSRLRNELTNRFKNKLLTDLNTKVLLTAHNYSEYAPVIFTNAELENVPDTYRNIKVVDALMATSSAPIYFDNTKLKLSQDPNEPAYNIIDGALFQNNPSSLAYAAAQMIYPSASKYCILSVGTGMQKIGLHVSSKEKEPSNATLLKLTNLYKIAMENSEIDNDILFKALNKSKNSNVAYYRFNVQLDNNRECDIDTSTPEFFDYLDTTVEARYKEDYANIKQFMNKMNGIENEQTKSNNDLIQINNIDE